MKRHDILMLVALIIFLSVIWFVREAICFTDVKYNTVEMVRAFVYRDGAIPSKDKRHKLIEATAKAIDENCERYGLDPSLVAASIYAESSYDPKSVGASHGETGVMQVHGMARAQCKRAGLDLSDLDDQIMCGTRWLSYLERNVCGEVFRDREKCLERRDVKSCTGAMSAYISGSCIPTNKKVAQKVAYRLRLARWAMRKTSPLLLY